MRWEKSKTHTHTSTLIWTSREQNEERNEEHTCNGTHRRDNVEMETKSRRQILISLITCRSRYQNRMCLCKSVKSKSQDKSNQDSQSFQLESRTIINSYRKTSTNPMDCWNSEKGAKRQVLPHWLFHRNANIE